MMARWLCTAIISALFFSSGCCCFRGPCDPCGRPTCCFSLPLLQCLHPIRWDGCSNDCGPSSCEPCGNYCNGCRDGLLAHCFLFGGLRGCLSCGRGCSEIYCDEWKSDPPDCCDPCDQCCGQFTGPHGYCCLGPCQRILAWLDGYKYCPPPNCGPWRPIFGHCDPCPPGGCGDIGCSTCGGGIPNGGDVYYDGVPTTATPVRTPRGTPTQNVAPAGGMPAPRALPEARRESVNVFEDGDAEAPHLQPKARPARPLPTGQQQPLFQMGGRVSQRMTPEQIATAKRAAQKRAYEAAGVRPTNYQP